MSPKLLKSKRYDNLFRDEASGTWFFRKYSSAKRRQFFRAIEGEGLTESRAYRSGLDSFNDWLGKVTGDQGEVYFGRYAKRYLELKLEDPNLSASTKATFKNQIEASHTAPTRKFAARPRLIDGIGHVPINQVNNEVWKKFVRDTRELVPGYKFFNARKTLLEILNDAHECGYISRVPKLDNPDGKAAPPRELTRDELRALFRHAHYVELVRGEKKKTVMRRDKRGNPTRVKNWIKLLMLIIWRQGARPGEIMKYEWAMIRLAPGERGEISIPGSITKTRRPRVIPLDRMVDRILRFLKPRASSPYLFPSNKGPDRPMKAYAKTLAGVCRRAGMKAQVYWFRDTFVTTKHRQGKSLPWIAKYIDSSAQVLEQRYAVASREDLAGVVDDRKRGGAPEPGMNRE